MGQDKALLPWKAGVLVEDVADNAAAVSGSVTLIGDPARYTHLKYPCIPDLRPGLGPLSGIETALACGRAELNLILACDMPEIEPGHLAALLAAAMGSDDQCVVTQDASGEVHPLCAVYRSTCLPAIQQALDEGRLKLTRVVQDLQSKVISMRGRICNINSMDEWNAIQHG